MPKLTKRGDVYVADLRDLGAGRVSLKTTNAAQAAIRYGEAIKAAQEGQRVATKPTGPTLGMLLDRGLRLHWKGHKSESSVSSRISIILEAIPSTTSLSALSVDHFDALVDHLSKRRNKSSTMNRVFGVLRTALTLAVDWKMMERPLKVPHWKEPPGRIRVFTREEEEQIINEFRRIGHHAMAELTIVLIDTGMRRGELLDREHLTHTRGERPTVRLEDTKNSMERTIPLTKRADEALASFLARENLTEGATEKRWDLMRRNLQQAHDKQFIIHTLRHTCCTRLVQMRPALPLPAIQRWMGHKDIATTMRYTHLNSADLEALANALEI